MWTHKWCVPPSHHQQQNMRRIKCNFEKMECYGMCIRALFWNYSITTLFIVRWRKKNTYFSIYLKNLRERSFKLNNLSSRRKVFGSLFFVCFSTLVFLKEQKTWPHTMQGHHLGFIQKRFILFLPRDTSPAPPPSLSFSVSMRAIYRKIDKTTMVMLSNKGQNCYNGQWEKKKCSDK